jgi:hypothetical protein
VSLSARRAGLTFANSAHAFEMLARLYVEGQETEKGDREARLDAGTSHSASGFRPSEANRGAEQRGCRANPPAPDGPSIPNTIQDRLGGTAQIFDK